MTIPFLNYFKKTAMPKQQITARPTHSVTAEKSNGARLSKTVMPNTTRTVSPQEEFETVPPPAAQPRVYSLGAKKQSVDLPPAVALALEPTVERVISLELKDVVGQMPAGWIRPLSDTEASRRVLLKAAEVEKGMSSGRPSICLTSVYNQVPEIFVRPVLGSDQTQVLLPFTKVLDQFTNAQTRSDQARDLTVPQLETPFLRVTLEDNTRFGTTMAPVQISDRPLANMEMATAETIAAAQPELFAKPAPPPPAPAVPATPQLPVTRSKDGSGPVIKLHVEEFQDEDSESISAPEKETAPAAAAEPTRIPFKISPIGTGAPASERVPASSGPSVPTSSPAPTRIAFKTNGEAVRAEGGAANRPNEFKTESTQKAGPKISLALKPILMAVPPFQLTGDLKEIPDDLRLEIPFSLVEPQLASGRVSLKADEFASLLPAEYRNFFSATDINAPVVLPLQDILKNLPAASLRMRDDQEEQEKGADFKTPFSAKAAEDAKRFGAPTALKPLKGLPQNPPELMPATPPKPEVAKTKSAVTKVAPPEVSAPEAPLKLTMVPPNGARPSAKISPNGSRTALQAALDTDDELDAKAVVAHVDKMAGVKACAIMFGDGLSLAGNLPGEYQAEGLCAMAPSFLQRLDDHMSSTKLGELRAMTVFCAKAAVTFFMHDNLCLAALHAKEELAADVRERLARAVHELSKKYSHPA